MKYNYIVTIVHRTRRFEKELACIPEYLQLKVTAWIKLVERVGIFEARKQKGYHDEPLKGQRVEERSIRLNRAYRLIYREYNSHVEILLLEVTKHEY